MSRDWREERLRRFVTPGATDACWEFTGHKNNPFGHGRMTIEGKRILAHRLAWEIENGPIPAGMCVCHKCDNPPCCNPNHLFLGTLADNIADRDRKGRHRCDPARGEAAGPSKLTTEQVMAIRADSRTQAAIAREYGVNPSAISFIKSRRTWRHLP